MDSKIVIGRFAPTPSGFMHAGNILCAMIAYLSAKSKGGKFIIRIEDADFSRCPRSAALEIIQTLAQFGIASDEPIVWQSERTAAYDRALKTISSRGEVYPCFCSRAELHAAENRRLPDGGVLYPGTCKKLSSAQKAARSETSNTALRLSVPDATVSFTDGICGEQSQNLASDSGDFIIKRSDGVYAYRLCVVVDDGESGVTEVVRGGDILYDTARQIYLQRLLGIPTPRYYHIPLVCDKDGRKLSKSEGDSAAKLLKEYAPDRIIGKLAFAAGIAPDDRPADLDSLIQVFDINNVRKDKIVL